MERMAAARRRWERCSRARPRRLGEGGKTREDIGRLGRKSDRATKARRRASGGAYLDFGKAAHVGFWTEWSGASLVGVAACVTAKRESGVGGIVQAARVDSGGGISVVDWGKEM